MYSEIKEFKSRSELKRKAKVASETVKSTNYIKKGYLYILLMVLILLVILSRILDKTAQNPQNISYSVAEKASTSFSVTQKAPLPLPKSGEIRLLAHLERIAPLTIYTPKGANFLIKLYDARSKREIMSVFVRQNDMLQTKVPIGEYIVKYVSGNEWYGYSEYFGTGSRFYETDNIFSFQNLGYQITGHKLYLQNVVNGNLEKRKISKQQF